MMEKEKIACPLYGTCPFATDIAVMKNDIAWIKRILFSIAVPAWLSFIVLLIRP